MLAADRDASSDTLNKTIVESGPEFVPFVVDHGLGPLWHERTGHHVFHASRMSAEALYIAQENAIADIDFLMEQAGIPYALIKGTANRLKLYENPAIRACHDIDLLVCPDDRVRAASVLVDAEFVVEPKLEGISRVLELTRDAIQIDLHWGLLREGRVKYEGIDEMLARRERLRNTWILSESDAFFVALVHPAFSKHLAGWDMGLHRVVDVLRALAALSFDWDLIVSRLDDNGVRTAAWATLRWIELLAHPQEPAKLNSMMNALRPGRLRQAWLNHWLVADLSVRTSDMHWIRLLGFSLFLHDSPRDAIRALAGRFRAHRRSEDDLAAFEKLFR